MDRTTWNQDHGISENLKAERIQEPGGVREELKAERIQELLRIAEALKTAVHLAGCSARGVERKLGLSSGYLSRLFSGGIELKVRHVLDISEVIELDPGEFLQLVLPAEGQPTSPTGRKLRDLVARITGTPQAAPSPALSGMTRLDLEELVRRAVRRLFAELGAGGR